MEAAQENLPRTHRLKKKSLHSAMAFVPSILAIVFTMLILRLVVSSAEEVRLRNSLIFDIVDIGELRWEPPNYPSTFKLDYQDPPIEFRREIEAIFGERSLPSADFENAVAIGSHLAVADFNSAMILSDSVTSLDSILHKGEGYCADFTQVYNGLALAMSLPVREWGMSFDGFSGDGHAFNEVYDRTTGRWVFIDSYFSFYVKDRSSGEPLSVLDFRERLRSEETRETIVVVPISEERFLFESADGALNYYQRGIDEFYMWWGNNVFEYDNSSIVSLASKVSRSFEQVVAILVGVHPEIRILRTPENEASIAELGKEKDIFLALLIGCLLTYTLVVGQVIRAVRTRSPR